MVKSNIIWTTEQWQNEEGQARLDETRRKIVFGPANYKLQLSRPNPAVYQRRINIAAEMGHKAGYDIMLMFGNGANSEAVKYFGGGYPTLFVPILFAIPTTPDAKEHPVRGCFPADLELGGAVKQYCERFGLDIDVELVPVGLTHEEYENRDPTTLENVVRRMTGKESGVKIGVITDAAMNSQSFVDMMRVVEAAIPGSKLHFDTSIISYLNAHRDEESAEALIRMHSVATAMADVALGCSYVNVPEHMIAGQMEITARNLGALGYGWQTLVAAGPHNLSTIGKALNEPLLAGEAVSFGGCPYGVVPVASAPTSRRTTWVDLDDISRVPEHDKQLYRASIAGFLAVKEEKEKACSTDEPYPLRLIDQANIDALERFEIRFPDGRTVRAHKLRDYSSSHLHQLEEECGAQQEGSAPPKKRMRLYLPQEGEGGDITFSSDRMVPTGISCYGHDSGAGGLDSGCTYIVIEAMGTMRKPGTTLTGQIIQANEGRYDLHCNLPIGPIELLRMTGTEVRTPEMYEKPLEVSKF